MRPHLIVGCLLSLGVHAGFFLLVPVPPLQPLPLAEPPTDMELLEHDTPLLPALQSPPLSQASPLDEETHAPLAPVAYDAAKIVPPDMQQIHSAIEQVSAGLSVPPSLPTPQLPTQRQTEDASALLSLPPSEVVATTTALLQQSLLAPKPTGGAEKQAEGGQVRLGEKQTPSRLALATLDPKLVARALPLPQAELPTLPPPPPHGIQGPAAQREPLSRPPSPKVQVQAESEITLKFWVRPDGVVSRVLPERKGDMALEAAAIRYLEGWRFTPLSLQEPQVEQWGMITVRFLPHAR